jgi:glycosyltransferase involved in cell wall biosynthesis
MRPSNILYFSSFGSIKGGGQKSLLLLFKHINKERYLPKCVTPNMGPFTEQLEKENIDYFIVPMGPTKSFNIPRILSTIIKLYKLIKTENIDIIHTDGPRNTFYGGIASKLAKVPVVTHIRVVDRPRFDDRIMAYLTDYFIFVSEAAKKRFYRVKDKVPFKIIYNGIDVKTYEKYQSHNNSFSVPGSFKKGRFSIGCIGRIERAKGQIYLIRAAKKVSAIFPGVDFIFIGEEDEDYLKFLKGEISSFKENIKFMGYMNNPYEIMKGLDIVVLPSLSEGFSRVILESMAMKKPVIATDVGGNSEAIIDGITGYLVPPKDPDALTQKILFLLRNRRKSVEMTEAGYLRVNDRFNIETNLQQIEYIYNQIRLSQ